MRPHPAFATPWVLLLHLWTLPNTLLGLFVGLALTFGTPRRVKGRGFVAFASGRGISKWVLSRGPLATTFGAAVLFWDPSCATDDGILEHEAYHVRQYLLLGPLFLPVYLAFVPFKGWRREHPLEKPAYRASDLKDG